MRASIKLVFHRMIYASFPYANLSKNYLLFLFLVINSFRYLSQISRVSNSSLMSFDVLSFYLHMPRDRD